MLRKYRQGAAAIELADLPKEMGWHWRRHGSRSRLRVALTWTRRSLRRRGRVIDPRLPSV
jgi:hypothetical protein